jgi:hypothetical protein
MTVSADRPVLCLSITGATPVASTAYEFHYPLEMGIVLRGRMERVFPGAETTVGPGDLWFCGMWEPHGYRIVTRPCHRVVLMIYPPFLAGTQTDGLPGQHWLLPFTVSPQFRPQASPDGHRVFLDLALRLQAALADEEPWRQMRLRLLVWEILLMATRSWQPPVTTPSPLPGDFERVKVGGMAHARVAMIHRTRFRRARGSASSQRSRGSGGKGPVN